MENTTLATLQSRPATPVPPPLQSRIDRHLLMCSAATVGATVAMTAGAHATVVASANNLNIAVPVTANSNQRVYIDFDTLAATTGTTEPAGSDLSLISALGSTASGYFKYNRLFAIGATATTGPVLSAQTTNQVGNAANLPAGSTINSASPFHQLGALAQHFYSSSGKVYNYGNFTTTGTSYLGFDFTDKNGQTRYGWLQVSFNATNFPANSPALTINRFAYDDSGLPILTGSLTAVPEPSALALGCLAAGATGLTVWRRKRAAQTAQA